MTSKLKCPVCPMLGKIEFPKIDSIPVKELENYRKTHNGNYW